MSDSRMGGAFGGKERVHIQMIAAFAAKKFNRDARLILPRKADFQVTGHRHETLTDYEVRRGKLLKFIKKRTTEGQI